MATRFAKRRRVSFLPTDPAQRDVSTGANHSGRPAYHTAHQKREQPALALGVVFDTARRIGCRVPVPGVSLPVREFWC